MYFNQPYQQSMSTINISRTHEYSIEELKIKIDVIKKVIEQKFEFRSEWETDQQLIFRRKGASGCLTIAENNFQLTLNLSMKYRMMKTEIKKDVLIIIDEYM